jgi:hypothetical protein
MSQVELEKTVSDEVCAECGKPSEVVCHGIRNNEIYDEAHCLECYGSKHKGKECAKET